MAKVIKNVDKLVTTAGTEIDFDNLQASGGSVSNASVGISRSENSTQLVYEFGTEIAINKANGSSVSASEMLHVGGAINNANHSSPSNGISVLSIASASDQIVSSALSVGRYGGSATSDGAKAFLAGGASDAGGGTFFNNIDQYDFASKAVAGNYSTFNTPRRYMSSSSDGQTAIFFGGITLNFPVFNTHEAVSFSGYSTATQWTDVSCGAGGGATSNGSESLLSVGQHADGLNSGAKRVRKISHSANESSESWGESTTASEWTHIAASNGVDALLVTSSGGTAQIEKLSFSDSSAHTVENSSPTALNSLGSPSSGSDGDHAFFIQGNSARSVSFDSGAAAANFCSMSTYRELGFGTQGN